MTVKKRAVMMKKLSGEIQKVLQKIKRNHRQGRARVLNSLQRNDINLIKFTWNGSPNAFTKN